MFLCSLPLLLEPEFALFEFMDPLLEISDHFVITAQLLLQPQVRLFEPPFPVAELLGPGGKRLEDPMMPPKLALLVFEVLADERLRFCPFQWLGGECPHSVNDAIGARLEEGIDSMPITHPLFDDCSGQIVKMERIPVCGGCDRGTHQDQSSRLGAAPSQKRFGVAEVLDRLERG